MEIVRTKTEMYRVLNECVETEGTETAKFPGMTYEEGLKRLLSGFTVILIVIFWMIDIKAFL